MKTIPTATSDVIWMTLTTIAAIVDPLMPRKAM